MKTTAGTYADPFDSTTTYSNAAYADPSADIGVDSTEFASSGALDDSVWSLNTDYLARLQAAFGNGWDALTRSYKDSSGNINYPKLLSDATKGLGAAKALGDQLGITVPTAPRDTESALITANAKRLEAETLRDKTEAEKALELAKFNQLNEKNLRDFGVTANVEGRNILNDMLFMDALRAPRAGVTGMTEPGWINQDRYDQFNKYYGMMGDRLWGDMNQTYKPVTSLSPLELVKTGATNTTAAGGTTTGGTTQTGTTQTGTTQTGTPLVTGGLPAQPDLEAQRAAKFGAHTPEEFENFNALVGSGELQNARDLAATKGYTAQYGYGDDWLNRYRTSMPDNTGGGDGFAKGGATQGGLSQASQAKFFRGGTKGQDDKIPAMLSDGEFVFDAETVAALGDGNTEAGASALEQMRQNVRKQKRKAPINKIPPKAKRPEAYLPKGVK